MSKGFISDEMIEDLSCRNCDVPFERGVDCPNWITCKNSIQQKGYNVEEPKSKLDEARNYCMTCYPSEKWQPGFVTYHNGHVKTKIELYELAIEELQEQQKPKIDDDLIEWLKDVASDNNNNYYGISFKGRYLHSLAERLLKQLGIKQ